MSLVYNNDKPIGKCESYSIDKIPGTTPFVMLTNYEPLRSELNENQQVVLEWLKDRTTVSSITSALWLLLDDALEVDYDTDGSEAWNRLPIDQKFQVLAAFADWGMKEVAE